MVPILATALVVFGVPTLHVAIRSREFRKFLAGAFFVSGGMQLSRSGPRGTSLPRRLPLLRLASP
jgi:hypothetical protein